MIRAVLFDMDGVLTDSERVGLTVTRKAGREMGFDIPESVVLKTLGVTWAESVDVFQKVHPALDVQELFDRTRARLVALGESGQMPLKPGVREILDTLDALGIPRAVASSNGPTAIAAYLRGCGIAGRFNQVVSGNECARSKPAPDVFLLAAERLGVPPESCLAVEDSPNGVKAGKAAGMTVCMIPDLIPFDESLRPWCDLVMPSLTHLAEYIRASGGQDDG